jgi:hypothetical protein
LGAANATAGATTTAGQLAMASARVTGGSGTGASTASTAGDAYASLSATARTPAVGGTGSFADATVGLNTSITGWTAFAHNAYANGAGALPAGFVTGVLAANPALNAVFGAPGATVLGQAVLAGFGAAGAGGPQTYSTSVTFDVNTALQPVPNNIVVGIVDQNTVGGGSAAVNWHQSLSGQILEVTFDLSITTSTAGDGYGVDLIWGDPAPTTYVGPIFSHNFSTLTDAANFFDANPVLDLGPAARVPEPASLGLLGGALALLTWRRRRSSRQARA